MYWNSEDPQRFIEGERAGLAASALYARLALSRAEANGQRAALAGDDATERHTHAMRERYRAAHREAMSFESEIEEEGDEYGDLDEYGYAA